MAPYRCRGCGHDTFEASVDIVGKVTGSLSQDKDGLTLTTSQMDPISFQCHRLRCAKCGEVVELRLVDIQQDGKEVFAEEMLVI